MRNQTDSLVKNAIGSFEQILSLQKAISKLQSIATNFEENDIKQKVYSLVNKVNNLVKIANTTGISLALSEKYKSVIGKNITELTGLMSTPYTSESTKANLSKVLPEVTSAFYNYTPAAFSAISPKFVGFGPEKIVGKTPPSGESTTSEDHSDLRKKLANREAGLKKCISAYITMRNQQK
jgi:hypothetical protein